MASPAPLSDVLLGITRQTSQRRTRPTISLNSGHGTINTQISQRFPQIFTFSVGKVVEIGTLAGAYAVAPTVPDISSAGALRFGDDGSTIRELVFLPEPIVRSRMLRHAFPACALPRLQRARTRPHDGPR